MSVELEYGVIITHSKRGELLDKKQIIELLKADNIIDIYDSLLNTEYGKELFMIPKNEVTATKMEHAILKTLVKRSYRLLEITPERERKVLEAFLNRYEVENLKRIIRIKYGEKAPEASKILIPIPQKYRTFNYEAMLEAKGIDEAMEYLVESPFYHIALKFRELSVLEVEALIDKIYFEKLIKTLKEEKVNGNIERMIRREIDLKNIERIAIYISKGLVLSKELMIPSGTLSLGRLLEASRVGLDVLKETPYEDLVIKIEKALLEKRIHKMRVLINKYMYEEAKKTCLRDNIKLGFMVGYIILCETEANNLISIVLGKELGMENEKIKEFLIL